MNLVGIIPLGGNATRMKHLPKFLLPCADGVTLLDRVVELYKSNNITTIESGVSVTNEILLSSNNDFNKTVVNTKTMAETIHQLILNQPPSKNIMVMPDTFFRLTNEIQQMISMLDVFEVVALVWKIQDYQIGKVGQCKVENGMIVDVIDKDPKCNYPYVWGVIGWRSSVNDCINPKWETIGMLLKDRKVGAVICEGTYYDCGTFKEYFKMIHNET